jgi:CRISPR-associated protein Csb2
LTAHKYDRSGRLAGYVRPKHLEGLTAVHVRLTFECAVAGPLSVGAGRHCGLGVLATMPPSAGG